MHYTPSYTPRSAALSAHQESTTPHQSHESSVKPQTREQTEHVIPSQKMSRILSRIEWVQIKLLKNMLME